MQHLSEPHHFPFDLPASKARHCQTNSANKRVRMGTLPPKRGQHLRKCHEIVTKVWQKNKPAIFLNIFSLRLRLASSESYRLAGPFPVSESLRFPFRRWDSTFLWSSHMIIAALSKNDGCFIDFSQVFMGVSKNRGIPKSSILIGFSIINIHFGVSLFSETPLWRENPTPINHQVAPLPAPFSLVFRWRHRLNGAKNSRWKASYNKT